MSSGGRIVVGSVGSERVGRDGVGGDDDGAGEAE